MQTRIHIPTSVYPDLYDIMWCQSATMSWHRMYPWLPHPEICGISHTETTQTTHHGKSTFANAALTSHINWCLAKLFIKFQTCRCYICVLSATYMWNLCWSSASHMWWKLYSYRYMYVLPVASLYILMSYYQIEVPYSVLMITLTLNRTI